MTRDNVIWSWVLLLQFALVPQIVLM